MQSKVTADSVLAPREPLNNHNDKRIKALALQFEIEFLNRMLRETFGGTICRCGVSLATIAKLLEHESTDVAPDCTGVDLHDMGSAMSQYILRLSAV